MAAVPLRGVSQRKGVLAEQESFEKTQVASIQKAFSSQEVPVKEKHARNTVMGTFHAHGAGMFWSVVIRQPLQANPIVAWKFCHVLHKLLRDGHPNVIIDSQKYQSQITDLGKLWGHLKDGYGRLILSYSKLLVQKLKFHKKFLAIPGNLVLTDDQLDEISGRDVNGYFEISANMFDYMDELLELAKQVFSSMDMSRSNSMTSAGQCKLAPLVQCILDSATLYDYLVKLLFKLHSSVPQDALGGHRDRFLKEYKLLKEFYRSSQNLQYFKTLIQIPDLPDDPPNFLIAAGIHSHRKPVVMVQPPEPEDLEPEPEIPLIDTTDNGDSDTSIHNGQAVELEKKDRLIEQLLREIERLKQEIHYIKSKAEDAIMKFKDKIEDLEDEIEQLRKQLDEKIKENESLHGQVILLEANEESRQKLEETEKYAKSSDEKFKKMKDIYQKLREEHVSLLRKHGEASKLLLTERKALEEHEEKRKEIEMCLVEAQREKLVLSETMQRHSDDSKGELTTLVDEKKALENSKQELEDKLSALSNEKSFMETTMQQLQTDLTLLREQLQEALNDKHNTEEKLRNEVTDLTNLMLTSALSEGKRTIEHAVTELDNPVNTMLTCTADYLLDRLEPLYKMMDGLQENSCAYQNDKSVLTNLITTITQFSHELGENILLGRAVSNSTPSEQDELLAACKLSGENGIEILESIRTGAPVDLNKLQATLGQIKTLTEALIPKMEDVKIEQIGDLVDQEMQATTKAIEVAAKKIQEMLEKSREQHTGIHLEVNERVLDSCTDLMNTIRVLIQKSKELQREIVAQGRGTSSAKDFYKKHHRWTEGLISAAKAVGWGANVLVEGADKLISGEGKFEELVVCSQEIAASTAQLVVSSKVKADRDSVALKELSIASKKVSQATGNVVASAKTGASMIEEQDTLDFSKITLHQAKRLEMNSQVRVLELESNLEKERVKLSELRKKHYQLAAESEAKEEEARE